MIYCDVRQAVNAEWLANVLWIVFCVEDPLGLEERNIS
jgi:hypothetical protein